MFRSGILIGVLCMLTALTILFLLPRSTPQPSQQAVLQSAR